MDLTPEQRRARNYRTAGHQKARRLYPVLGDCERCDAPAVERHHKDDDTHNNARSNLEFLCRRCHMAADGRLAVFESTSMSKRGPQPPISCANCGRLSKPIRRGRCHACTEYWRRNGAERPYKIDGRQEKALKAMEATCRRCARPAGVVGNPVRGFCRSCYAVLHRKGELPQ